MRIKHHGVFQSGMKILNWENLRNSEMDKPYFLPYNKEDYLFKVQVNEPSNLTKRIIKELENASLKKIFSIGSGIAFLEYQIKKFSNLNVVVSDYNSSVLRLKQFEVFDDALLLNALQDPLPVNESCAVLFPRIDTEFDDDQLRELFSKCFSSGIKQIYFIPGELLSLRIIMAELKAVLISIIKRKPLVFCGHARSMSSFKKIWTPYYQLTKKYSKDKQMYFLLSKLT